MSEILRFRLSKVSEGLVRFQLESKGWIVFEPRGLENVHVDMIAVKWVRDKLLLRAIQVKARTGFGDEYPYVEFRDIFKDKNLFYIVCLTSEKVVSIDTKWSFYVIPSLEVKQKALNIDIKNNLYAGFKDSWKVLESE